MDIGQNLFTSEDDMNTDIPILNKNRVVSVVFMLIFWILDFVYR
jgi:hypothetical protein